jgi:DNA primase
MVVDLLKLLETVLGGASQKSKGNYAFHCPFCNHTKKKLEIQPETQYWNCWVCGTKGKSLYTLFKRVNAKEHHFSRLGELLPKVKRIITDEKSDIVKVCNLPKEYIPLWIPNHKNFLWSTCIDYLSKRGITLYDILKYRIGYCISGKYENMIVFPNYDKSGQLTYFTTRTFLNRNKSKFVNPPFSRNVVGFEMQLNWQLPLILVESALDAITVKRNASPLYGTTLSKALRMQILENGVSDLYIALDNDALVKSIKIAEYFMGFGVNVYFVKLPKNSDPNSLGYDKMWNLIDSAEPLSSQKLFEYKIQELL